MFTIGLALKLKTNGYSDYKKAHDEIWPNLAAGMGRCGISMAIYRHGETLFVFAAAPSHEHWQRNRDDPILRDWNARMTQFLQTDEGGDIAFEHLEKAFGFGDFQ